MTVHQLHEMLGDLDDRGEIVIEATHVGDEDPLLLAWRSADQADAAQDALATAAMRLPRAA
jgi:hypothetical protein